MSYRFIIVNTDYPAFMEQMYLDKPGLWSRPFSEQYTARTETLFGVSDFYSSNLRKLGHEAIDLFYNNRFMQYAWAVENGVMQNGNLSQEQIVSLPDAWLAAVLQAQIKIFRPDVVVNLAMDGIGSNILAPIKSEVPLIVGQHAAPINSVMDDLTAYDLIVSSIPGYVTYFRQLGKNSEHFKLAFETTILDTIRPANNRAIDIAFAGGFSAHHLGGAELFNYLADKGFIMDLYGYGEDSLSPKARTFFKGSLYGKSMYELYASAKIVINRHINISGEDANNMRLYEATGMGACLLTDVKRNLSDIFKVNNEVLSYSSPEECAQLIGYCLEQEDERKQIASNGQRRTLSEHTYYHRMAELAEIVDKYFPKNRQPSLKAADTTPVPQCTQIDVSSDNIEAGLQKIKQLANKNRFGSWEIYFNGLTISCHDLLSFYMAAKDIFLHRIYDFKANTSTPTIIDGGGHIGLFTLYAKQKYPNAKVTVFEPDAESLAFLRKNLQSNSITDVTIVEAGLHKENGKVSFTCDHSDGSSISESNSSTSINVVKLSDYINSDVDFMKLNIEGAECGVITEMAPKLESIKELVIEYHGFPEVGQNLHKILAVLDKTGFRYSIHDFDAETNPATKPPFSISEASRFFLLIYAKKLFQQTASNTLTFDHTEQNTSLHPISRQFGFDRGTPIDRYYIENFLKTNASAITGRVLEIADNAYTTKFGTGVTQSDVLSAIPSPNATIIGDLATGHNISESAFDCIIMTQTAQMIYNVKAAMKNAVKALKPGGTLLLTASGISQISRYDMDRWGEYWRFTDKSLKMLFGECVPEESISIESHGNVAIAKAFLDGLACEELDEQTLNYNDNDYQVLLTAAVCKPAQQLPYNITNTVRQSGHEVSQQDPLVLLYHRVANDPIDSQLLAVSPNNFEAHLRELAENYRVIPLHQLLAEARTGQVAPNTTAITFDDGYLDNLTNALPLLEKYGLHATIFVTSGMVGSEKEFWWDALEKLFLVTPNIPQSLNVSYAGGHFDLDLTTPEERLKALDELAGFLRLQPVKEIEDFVDKLFEWAQIGRIARNSHRIVTPEQLRQLAASPSIEIGSHTVTHTKLSCLSPDAQLCEIRHSKQYLESVIGTSVRMLSYPFGTAADFTAETIRITTEEGYEAGIANIPGTVTGPVDLYSVPRHLVRNWSPEQFNAWLRNSDKSTLEAQTIAGRVEKLTENTTVFTM